MKAKEYAARLLPISDKSKFQLELAKILLDFFDEIQTLRNTRKVYEMSDGHFSVIKEVNQKFNSFTRIVNEKRIDGGQEIPKDGLLKLIEAKTPEVYEEYIRHLEYQKNIKTPISDEGRKSMSEIMSNLTSPMVF